MDRPIRWTQVALTDLESIAAYIARDSPAHAAEFVTRVLDLADTLGQFPKRGHVVPEFRNESLRELPYKGYRLLYEIMGDTIYIQGVIHGARDLTQTSQGHERLDDES